MRSLMHQRSAAAWRGWLAFTRLQRLVARMLSTGVRFHGRSNQARAAEGVRRWRQWVHGRHSGGRQRVLARRALAYIAKRHVARGFFALRAMASRTRRATERPPSDREAPARWVSFAFAEWVRSCQHAAGAIGLLRSAAEPPPRADSEAHCGGDRPWRANVAWHLTAQRAGSLALPVQGGGLRASAAQLQDVAVCAPGRIGARPSPSLAGIPQLEGGRFGSGRRGR